MASTQYNNQATDVSVTNLTQSKSYNEGQVSLLLDVITFNNGNDYNDVLTLTLDVSGGDVTLFTLESTTEAATIVQTDPDTWTISSQYTKNGYTVNNWADLATTLSGLYIAFNNDDASDSYSFAASFTDGHSTEVGTITITGFAVVDAVNIVQSITATEDQYLWVFGTDGGSLIPAISDTAEAGKTYRVTLVSPAASAIFYSTASVLSGSGDHVSTIVFEGTQTQINNALASSDGVLYIVKGPDDNGPYTITYTQEVISGNPGVPYVQETGQFDFTYSANDASDTAVSNINYSEDIITNEVVATINDSRGTTMASSALKPAYNATVTLADPNSGTINGWTNAGGGVFTYTNYNGSGEMTNELNAFGFAPAADYTGNTSMTLTLTRDHQVGDNTWHTSGQTNQQTLINAAPITLTNVGSHAEYTYNTTQVYGEDIVTNWNLASITDLATGKTYTITLTVSDVNAIDSIAGWTNVGGGVFTYTNSKAGCNAELADVNATPAADYTGNYTMTYGQNQDTDSINHGTSGNITITNNATHNEYNIGITTTADEYAVTNINMGSITDLATGKNYTITLVLSNLTTGVINAPWVVGVPGTYTVSGTKANLNTYLSQVPFNTTTVSDDKDTGSVTISYQQQQTTDSIDQGYKAVGASITISGVTDGTNVTQSNIAIIEDQQLYTFATAPQIDDQLGAGSGKTYRVTMSPNTGASDVYKMFTDSAYVVGATYASTLVFEGTQTQINNAIVNNWHLDKTTPDDTTNFVIKWLQEVIAGATGAPYVQDTGLLTFDVTPDVDSGMTVYAGYYAWNVGQTELLTDLAVITDTRGDQFDAANILYRASIQFDSPVTNADGNLSSGGTGGTTVWDGTDTLTIEGTKTQVNSHLAATNWNAQGTFSDAFTMTITLDRNINSEGWLFHRQITNILMDSGNGATSHNADRRYDEDERTLLNDASKLT